MCQTRGAKSCQQLGNEKLPVGSEGPRAILCQWRGVHLNLHHPVTYQRECTSRCASLILLLVKSKVILYPHNNLQLSYPIPAVLAKSWTWGRWSVYSMLHKHCGSGVCMWQCWGSLCTGGAKWKLRFSTISYLNQVDVTASVLLTKQHMSYLCYTLCTAVNMTRSLKKTKQTKKAKKPPKNTGLQSGAGRDTMTRQVLHPPSFPTLPLALRECPHAHKHTLKQLTRN